MEFKLAVSSLSALAQPTRLRAYQLLASAGADGITAGEIARRLEIPANTMSAHLSILMHAGLADSERNGREIVYRAEREAVRRLIAFLETSLAAE